MFVVGIGSIEITLRVERWVISIEWWVFCWSPLAIIVAIYEVSGKCQVLLSVTKL